MNIEYILNVLKVNMCLLKKETLFYDACQPYHTTLPDSHPYQEARPYGIAWTIGFQMKFIF